MNVWPHKNGIIPYAVGIFFICMFCCEVQCISNCRKVLEVSCHLTVKMMLLRWPTTKISCDPELTELTRNHRTWCMLLRLKYCLRTQCCCIWLTFKTFQRYVSFKICKGLFYWNNNYNCVRRFVVSDPKLPDSLYAKQHNIKVTILNKF